MGGLSVRSWFRRNPLFVLCLCSLLIGSGAGETVRAGENRRADLYVSPQGRDTWSGTRAEPNGDGTDGPFATLERALQASRQRKAAGQPGSFIAVREGTYFPGKALELNPDDSGTADRPLTFAAYPGEHPVIEGGMKLSGTWRKKDQEPLWSISLPDLPRPVEDLFVEGKRMPCARLPKTGSWHAIAVDQSRTQFRFEPGQLQAWPDAANGRVVIKSREWFEETVPIGSIDMTGRTVTLAKESAWSLAGDGLGASGDYFIENVREAVTQPGEWCFDPTSRLLLFWPPEGVDPNRVEIVAGGLPLLVSVAGDMAHKRWAEHIVFDGLAFAHTGRCDGAPMLKGAALCLKGGVRHCEVRGCRFADLGGCGVVLWKECQGNRVSGSEFTGIGETAVRIYSYLGEGPPGSAENVVENNAIRRGGTVVRHSAAIEMENTGGNRIARNLISDMPYCGIILNGDSPGNWNPAASPGLEPPYTGARIMPFIPSRGNTIEFNRIEHVMRELGDGGGIYLWGVMGAGANVIRNNLIEHSGERPGTCVGIYLDENCNDARVTDNVVNDAGYGFHLNGAPRDILENNVFAYSRQNDISIQPLKDSVRPLNAVLRNNIFFQCAGSPFRDTSWAPWDRLPLRECDGNLYWRGGKPVALGQGDFSGFDRHSLVADPQFEDPEHGDFRLKAGSPALVLGIHSIEIPGRSN